MWNSGVFDGGSRVLLQILSTSTEVFLKLLGQDEGFWQALGMMHSCIRMGTFAVDLTGLNLVCGMFKAINMNDIPFGILYGSCKWLAVASRRSTVWFCWVNQFVRSRHSCFWICSAQERSPSHSLTQDTNSRTLHSQGHGWFFNLGSKSICEKPSC